MSKIGSLLNNYPNSLKTSIGGLLGVTYLGMHIRFLEKQNDRHICQSIMYKKNQKGEIFQKKIFIMSIKNMLTADHLNAVKN